MSESEITRTTRQFAPLYDPTGDERVDRLAFFHVLEHLKVCLRLPPKHFKFGTSILNINALTQTQKRTGWVDNNASRKFQSLQLSLIW